MGKLGGGELVREERGGIEWGSRDKVWGRAKWGRYQGVGSV